MFGVANWRQSASGVLLFYFWRVSGSLRPNQKEMMSTSQSTSWECPACTWPNDHPYECIMCQSARPPSALVVGGGSTQLRTTRLAAVATESTTTNEEDNTAT